MLPLPRHSATLISFSVFSINLPSSSSVGFKQCHALYKWYHNAPIPHLQLSTVHSLPPPPPPISLTTIDVITSTLNTASFITRDVIPSPSCAIRDDEACRKGLRGDVDRTGKGSSSTDLHNKYGMTYRIVSPTQKVLKVCRRYRRVRKLMPCHHDDPSRKHGTMSSPYCELTELWQVQALSLQPMLTSVKAKFSTMLLRHASSTFAAINA